jgi:hypothetical protein
MGCQVEDLEEHLDRNEKDLWEFLKGTGQVTSFLSHLKEARGEAEKKAQEELSML